MNPHHVAPQRLSLSPRLPPLAWVVGALLFVSLLGGPSGLATSAPGAPAVTLHSPNPGELHMEWPAATPAPSTYQVQWTRTDVVEPAGHASSVTNTLTLYELEPGVVYTVRVRAGAGPWSVPVVQRIDDYRADPETVGTIGVGAGEDGYIESAGDADWFFVDLAAGEGYPIAVTGAPAPPLAVYDATGAVVQQGLAWHHAGALTFTPATAGLYHLAVGGPAAEPGRYTLTVAEPPTAEPRRSRTLAGVEPTDPPAPRSPTAVPAKPRGLTATATHAQVVLTWNDPGDATITGYVILRRVRVNNQGGSFSVLVADTGTAALTYTDATVAAGITYTYRIKALNAYGVSQRSRWVHIDTPAVPVPAKPTGLTATATHGQVVLTWDDPGDASITGYMILRRDRENDEKGAFRTLVADTGSAALTYTDETVAAGARLTYRIKALNAHGASARSRWFHIDTLAPPIVVRPPGDGSALWTGTLSAGTTTHAGEPIVGYSVWNGTGALSATTFAAGGRTVTVQVVMLGTGPERTLYLGLSERLEGDVALVVGTEEYRLSEAELLRGMGWVYEWDAPELSWEEGEEVSVSIGASGSAPAPEGNAPGEDAPGEDTPGDTEPGEAGLRDLSLSGVTGLSFSGARTRYEARRGDAQSTTVSVVGGGDVTVLTVRSDEPLSFDDADADGGQAGHQVRLAGAGQTLVLVVSRSADGAHERVYAVKVRGEAAQGRTRVRGSEAGSDATLSALTLSGAALAPAFASGTYEYAASVGADVASVSVTATAAQSGAETLISPADADTGTAGHQVALSVGETPIIVVVRSADRSALESYVVTVTRAAPADDASLAALSLDGLVLSPAFDADVYEYAADVAADVEEITVTAGASGDGAKVSIAPDDADDNAEGHQVALVEGANTITITVATEDGQTTQEYVVTVTRAPPPADDASLAELGLAGIELSPAFSGDVYAYSASVAADVDETTVTAEASDAGAEVSVTPDDADDNAEGHQVALVEGANTITVTVTAEDGQTTQKYVVTVTRAEPSDDASLAELSLEGLELSPAFDADTRSYTASAGAAAAWVTLVARPNDAGAAVVISPADTDADAAGWQIYLAAAEPWDDPAQTNIVIVVTSGDSTARKTYLVQVSRMPRSRAPADSEGFVQVDAGWDDICALRVDGTLECWRPSGFSAGSHRARLRVGTPEGIFTDVIAANLFACGIRDDDTGFCWGDDLNGRRFENADVASVSAHTFYGICMGHADGDATCYRYSWSDQRMDSPQDDSVSGSLRSVVTGRMFGCGLDEDGRARCWKPGGWLDAPDEALKFIAAGGTQVCGIKEADSSLMCWEWAYGSSWRLTGPRNEYTHLTDEPEGEFIHVDTSYGPSCAVKSDGAVVCWGSASMISTERMLEELNDVPEGEYLTVSVDWDWFACGLRTDQTIACWGYNNEVLTESIPPFESPWKDSADLLGLEIGDGELSPDFDRDTTAYRVTVASNVASVVVTPQLTNTLATYTVSSDQDAEVLDGEIDLSAGANTITVTVTSADATATQTYTVIVTREADLSKSQPPSPQNVRAVAEQAGDKQGGRPKRVG